MQDFSQELPTATLKYSPKLKRFCPNDGTPGENYTGLVRKFISAPSDFIFNCFRNLSSTVVNSSTFADGCLQMQPIMICFFLLQGSISTQHDSINGRSIFNSGLGIALIVSYLSLLLAEKSLCQCKLLFLFAHYLSFSTRFVRNINLCESFLC